MNSKIFFINIILVIFILFEGMSIIRLWNSEKSFQTIEKIKKIKQKPLKTIRLHQLNELPLSAYTDSVKKNLFSEKRTEYTPEKIKSEPKKEVKGNVKKDPEIKKLNTSKILLFGIILMEDIKKALVSDVDKTSDRPSIWVEQGDSIDGFLIDSIEKDRLIVSNSGEKFSILLYDKKKPKKRKSIQKKNQKKSSKKIITKEPKKQVIAPKTIENENTKFEVISTPFGDFKRKKKK